MDQHEGFDWIEHTVTLLATIGAMTAFIGLYMVLARIVNGYWPACGW